MKRYAILMLAVGLFAMLNCGGGGGSENGTTTSEPEQTPSATADYGMVMGVVKDMSGNAIPRVDVTIDGVTIQSNDQGYFSMDDIQATARLVVVFEKKDYCMTARVTSIEEGLTRFLEPTMSRYEKKTTIDSDVGDVVATPDNCSVDIKGGTLVDSAGNPYSGQATVAIATFDPTTDEGLNAFPGDFAGLRQDGSTVQFTSYGFVDIEVTSATGEKLQLAANEEASVAIPIAPSLVASAPDTIPLWYFDQSDGRWKEEGQMVKDGNVYRGSLSHFSPFNCDDPMWGLSWVTGVVVDRFGNLVRGARVWVRGRNQAWIAGETSTPQTAIFRFTAQASSQGTLYASKNGAVSPGIPITTSEQTNTLDVGEVMLDGIPAVRSTLTWGRQPDDLDAHLLIPRPNGTYAHIYWEVAGDKIENSRLDTDDVNSYGPEIMTSYVLNDGTYRYGVHHYLGNNTISSSEAVVNLLVDGLGIYTFSPPTDASGTDDLWIVYDLTVSNGRVVNVTPVNQIVSGVVSEEPSKWSP